MTVKINNKEYNIPDNEIEKNMKALEIPREEAIELWLDDHDITINEEQEELDQQAKQVKIQHGAAAAEKKERKPREKKVNPAKKQIIETFFNALEANFTDISDLTARNDEKYIDFTLDGIEYTVNLVAHRAKK